MKLPRSRSDCSKPDGADDGEDVENDEGSKDWPSTDANGTEEDTDSRAEP